MVGYWRLWPIGITFTIVRVLISWIAPEISPNEYAFTRMLYKLTEPTLSRARRWLPINYRGVDFSPLIVIFVAMVTKIFISVFLIPIIFVYLH